VKLPVIKTHRTKAIRVAIHNQRNRLNLRNAIIIGLGAEIKIDSIICDLTKLVLLLMLAQIIKNYLMRLSGNKLHSVHELRVFPGSRAAVYAKRLDPANYREVLQYKSRAAALRTYKCISFPKKSIRDTVA